MQNCLLIQELSKDSREAVRGFLTKVREHLSLIIKPSQDPEKRLGAEGANSVKDHSFFCGIDWPAMEQVKKKCQTQISQTFQGTIAPPFVPELNGDGDTSNFDDEFTNNPLEETKIKMSKAMKSRCENGFPGFTFTAD